MSEWIRPGEAAKMLGVSTDTIGRYVDLGIINGQRTPGGQRRVERESVENVTRTRVSSTVTIIGVK
ncbi:MAG: MerR family DNA-binding transcriptional regulator [Candidatus Nanopelagicales bacterium]